MGLQFAAYAFVSSCLASATLSYAVHTRQQFYPIVVFLVTSKISVVILGNFALLCTLLAGRLAKTFFLGRLRDQEREIMYDRARYAITETCLALTIFHEELSVKVFALFTALLFSKVFHWLCECRVDFIQQDDGAGYWAHIRLVALIGTLLLTDVALLSGCAWLSLQHMPSVLILFGFEYAILAVAALATAGKYVLHCVDARVEGAWQAKGSWSKALDFGTEACRFALFLTFFGIIFTYYGMPLHIVRELWVSYTNLRKCWQQYRKYQRLMRGLNDRFPDATEQDMAAEGGGYAECIICRDDLGPGCKRLPCGHVFHLDCLRLWLQEKQDCPTCRADIPVDAPLPDRRRRPRDVVPNANAAQAAEGAEAARAAAADAIAAEIIAAADAADAGADAPADGGAAAAVAAALEWVARGGDAAAAGLPARRLLRAHAPPPLDLPAPLAPALRPPAFAPPTPPLAGAPLPGSPVAGPSFGGPSFGGAPFPGSPLGGFAGTQFGGGVPFGGYGGSPFGGSPFGSFFPAPFGGPAAPTLLKVRSPLGASLVAHPHAGAAETRRVPRGAVLVAAAPHLEPGGAEPSFYATPEGDWLPMVASDVEVLRPPAAGGAFNGGPASPWQHSAPPSPFPATPFGSPFGSPFGAAAAPPLASPAFSGAAAAPSAAAPGADVASSAEVAALTAKLAVAVDAKAALTAELAALRAMVEALQAKDGGSAEARPTEATPSAAEAAAAEAPAGDIAGSVAGGAAEEGSEGLRRRKPAAEAAADA